MTEMALPAVMALLVSSLPATTTDVAVNNLHEPIVDYDDS